MNISTNQVIIYLLIGAVIWVLLRYFSNKNTPILPNWTNKELDGTIIVVGMLYIFGKFISDVDVQDKDVFTRIVEIFNGIWLLILGYQFGKKNGENGDGNHNYNEKKSQGAY